MTYTSLMSLFTQSTLWEYFSSHLSFLLKISLASTSLRATSKTQEVDEPIRSKGGEVLAHRIRNLNPGYVKHWGLLNTHVHEDLIESSPLAEDEYNATIMFTTAAIAILTVPGRRWFLFARLGVASEAFELYKLTTLD